MGLPCPPNPGECPQVPRSCRGGPGLRSGVGACVPLTPAPVQAGLRRGACWRRACVLGFGSGVRSARRAWGAQAWACSLCSPTAGSSPARLPWPARSTARGPVPTRSLHPECPGLSSAQTRQGPPGSPVLSVSVSPPLPAPLHPPRPAFGLTSARPAAPQIPTHRVTGHLRAHCLQPGIPQPQGQWHPA